MTTKSQVTKTHNTKKDNSTQVSIIVVLLCVILASVITSCSTNKQVYRPSKASNSLTVCNHVGCYTKK